MSEQKSQSVTRRELELQLITKAWKDEAFKQELIRNSKAVYAKESGQQMPQDLKVQVLEETSNTLYLVIPRNPDPTQDSKELSDEALEAVSGGFIIIATGDTAVVTG